MTGNEIDYEGTPSYFTNCEYFNQYLGRTSYYTALQNSLYTSIRRVKPEKVLELGCALGVTMFNLADKFPDMEFSGLDIRNDIVSKTNRSQEKRDFLGKDNASFIRADMTEFCKTEEIANYDFIYMLYSFHHIEDPDRNKVEFLKNMYQNMKKGAYLWIGETFLPENGMGVLELWDLRAKEGRASTFWNSLSDHKNLSIEKASAAADVSHDEEYKAGMFVDERNGEYLVTRTWTIHQLKNAGFSVVINHPVNALSDAVILVKKE